MSTVRVAVLLLILAAPVRAQDFLRSDCNGDGGSNVADAVHILLYLFPPTPAPPPTCLDACDVNDDGSVNITDAVFVLQFLKPVSLPNLPPAPYQVCGPDPTADSLDCALYAPCP